jgi:membrane-associated protein
LELIYWFVDLILHLDRHLVELLVRFDVWIYAILFLIIFSETGFVVTPFLPGDSLLFAVGALAAVDTSGTLKAPLVCALLILAAILGNTTNYAIGRWIGPPAFSGRYRFLKIEYLRRTEAFFLRYGGMTIVMSRFVPIVRTFAPFVAGVGRMPYARFQAYNIAGGASWVLIFVWGGYFFGNIPIVKNNFGVVTILIIIVSVLPVVFGMLKERRGARVSSSSQPE